MSDSNVFNGRVTEYDSHAGCGRISIGNEYPLLEVYFTYDAVKTIDLDDGKYVWGANKYLFSIDDFLGGNIMKRSNETVPHPTVGSSVIFELEEDEWYGFAVSRWAFDPAKSMHTTTTM